MRTLDLRNNARMSALHCTTTTLDAVQIWIHVWMPMTKHLYETH